MVELAERFETIHGARPDARVEAPGRVNLMGDHIDYNGLPVLPMAVQRRVTLLVRTRPDSLVRIATTTPGFDPHEFRVADSVNPFPAGDWGNYAKAAIHELAPDTAGHAGFDALVHSDIPVAAGLSSSSALVVAFALAFLHANRREMSALDLAQRMAAAEHFVGTRGGGMDQAICLGGKRGAACRIDFDPLRIHCHRVPPEWTFLVACSGVRAEKSGASRTAYNERTAECRVALRSVTSALGNAAGTGWRELLAMHSADALVATAGNVLDDGLFRRFRHVVTEADRVSRCVQALERNSPADFGYELSASHVSLARDYEVSIPELDHLVECAVGAGAAGARLTGAGFGGCAVALCAADRTAAVQQALRSILAAKGLDTAALLFVAQPAEGARVTPL